MRCLLKGENELNLTSSNQTCPGIKFRKSCRRTFVSFGIVHHMIGRNNYHFMACFALGVCSSAVLRKLLHDLYGKIPVQKEFLSREFATPKFYFQMRHWYIEIFSLCFLYAYPFTPLTYCYQNINVDNLAFINLSQIPAFTLEVYRKVCGGHVEQNAYSVSWFWVSPEERGVCRCLMFLCIQVSIYPYSYIDIYLLYIGVFVAICFGFWTPPFPQQLHNLWHD